MGPHASDQGGRGPITYPVRIDKTVYDAKGPKDGKRILVMRLWPRGIRKTTVDMWLKDVGTSRELIKDWKGGKITWAKFKQRYKSDMKGEAQRELVKQLASYARSGTITLLCSCQDPNRCHRSLLKELVEYVK